MQHYLEGCGTPVVDSLLPGLLPTPLTPTRAAARDRLDLASSLLPGQLGEAVYRSKGQTDLLACTPRPRGRLQVLWPSLAPSRPLQVTRGDQDRTALYIRRLRRLQVSTPTRPSAPGPSPAWVWGGTRSQRAREAESRQRGGRRVGPAAPWALGALR